MALYLPAAPIFEPYRADLDLFCLFLTWYDCVDELTSMLREEDVNNRTRWQIITDRRIEVMHAIGEGDTVSARRTLKALDRLLSGPKQARAGEKVNNVRNNYLRLLGYITHPNQLIARCRVLIKDSLEGALKNVYGPLKRRGQLTDELKTAMNHFRSEFNATISQEDVDVHTLIKLAVKLRFLVRRMGAALKPTVITRLVNTITGREASIAHHTHRSNLLEPIISQRKMQLYHI